MVNFSIITPWLPPRESIKQNMEYVNAQSYPYWEHLISIDRLGYDNAISASDDRRHIIPCGIEHKNWGNACRHNLWEKASGDWIIYLDDDDILYPNALETIAQAIESSPNKDWGYFAIMLGAGKFFHNPPGGGLITGGQVFHRKVGLDGTPFRWYDTTNYAADWDLIYQYFIKDERPPILIDQILGELPKHGKGQV